MRLVPLFLLLFAAFFTYETIFPDDVFTPQPIATLLAPHKPREPSAPSEDDHIKLADIVLDKLKTHLGLSGFDEEEEPVEEPIPSASSSGPHFFMSTQARGLLSVVGQDVILTIAEPGLDSAQPQNPYTTKIERWRRPLGPLLAASNSKRPPAAWLRVSSATIHGEVQLMSSNAQENVTVLAYRVRQPETSAWHLRVLHHADVATGCGHTEEELGAGAADDAFLDVGLPGGATVTAMAVLAGGVAYSREDDMVLFRYVSIDPVTRRHAFDPSTASLAVDRTRTTIRVEALAPMEALAALTNHRVAGAVVALGTGSQSGQWHGVTSHGLRLESRVCLQTPGGAWQLGPSLEFARSRTELSEMANDLLVPPVAVTASDSATVAAFFLGQLYTILGGEDHKGSAGVWGHGTGLFPNIGAQLDLRLNHDGKLLAFVTDLWNVHILRRGTSQHWHEHMELIPVTNVADGVDVVDVRFTTLDVPVEGQANVREVNVAIVAYANGAVLSFNVDDVETSPASSAVDFVGKKWPLVLALSLAVGYFVWNEYRLRRTP